MIKYVLTAESGIKDPDAQVLKIGHGGNLDSRAVGLMAVGVGDGCKLLSNYLHGDKVMCGVI